MPIRYGLMGQQGQGGGVSSPYLPNQSEAGGGGLGGQGVAASPVQAQPFYGQTAGGMGDMNDKVYGAYAGNQSGIGMGSVGSQYGEQAVGHYGGLERQYGANFTPWAMQGLGEGGGGMNTMNMWNPGSLAGTYTDITGSGIESYNTEINPYTGEIDSKTLNNKQGYNMPQFNFGNYSSPNDFQTNFFNNPAWRSSYDSAVNSAQQAQSNMNPYNRVSGNALPGYDDYVQNLANDWWRGGAQGIPESVAWKAPGKGNNTWHQSQDDLKRMINNSYKDKYGGISIGKNYAGY